MANEYKTDLLLGFLKISEESVTAVSSKPQTITKQSRQQHVPWKRWSTFNVVRGVMSRAREAFFLSLAGACKQALPETNAVHVSRN
jgi:hypothetical protein